MHKFTPEEFEDLVREFNEKEEELMSWKAKEYSTEVDRLQNFREVAFLEGRKMSQVSFSYLLKHMQSIALVVNNDRVKWYWENEGKEGTKQRIADARNYLILLAACLEEEEEGLAEREER